jgi:hypothetical protein
MKYFYLGFLWSVFFCSCGARYTLYHTDCNNSINKADSMYVFENDTVRIAYDFWQNKGKMSFSIYNKLGIPIFIDWKNSALIINDNKYAYWVEKETRNGTRKGYVSNSASFSTENSVAVKDERVSSIPPHSKIRKIASDKLRRTVNPKIDDFKMTFRNFIAISTTEDVKLDNYVDNEFVVVKVEKSKKLPMRNLKEFYTIH